MVARVVPLAGDRAVEAGQETSQASRIGALVLALLMAVAAMLVAAAPQAVAAARVSISAPQGIATDAATAVTVSGTGFQSIDGGFGGIYVMIGVVSGTWQPSQGGSSGTNYKYIPDEQSKSNQGYLKFVAFPGSSTAAEANGGLIAADGSWSTSITIPGATIQVAGQGGAAESVDCRVTTCGIITIGAHGQTNANNETFTPLTFAAAATQTEQEPQPAAPTGAAAATGAATSGAAGTAGTSSPAPTATTDAQDADEASAAPVNATLGVDQSTAVAGRVLSFTGQGFTPGEQVIGSLDDGVVAVGPLNAGNAGEVAGVIELPDGLRQGTHVLKLTGAASGAVASVEFVTRLDAAQVAASQATQAEPATQSLTVWDRIIIGAGLILVAVVVASAITAIRRRRARSQGGATQ